MVAHSCRYGMQLKLPRSEGYVGCVREEMLSSGQGPRMYALFFLRRNILVEIARERGEKQTRMSRSDVLSAWGCNLNKIRSSGGDPAVVFSPSLLPQLSRV